MVMKPILFNTEMVQAIMEGRKTVTRRVVKFPNGYNPQWSGYIPDGPVLYGSNNIPAAKASYKPGDILYVRETWRVRDVYGDIARGDRTAEIEYKAGGPTSKVKITEDVLALPGWNPSIHMPKIAARLFLRVNAVRAERLQNITINGLQDEGIIPQGYISQYAAMSSQSYFDKFKDLWGSTIKPVDQDKYSWAANPWVWVIEFERCEKSEE